MASISPHPESGVWHVQFIYAGKPFHKSLKTRKEKDAKALLGRIQSRLYHLNTGTLQLPPGADLWQWLLSDGQRGQKPEPPEKPWTLKNLFAWYFDNQTENAKETNTLGTERTHQKHLLRLLGESRLLSEITVADLQGYTNQRARDKWRGKPIKTDTIQKEIASLSMVWNRASKLMPKFVPVQCPTDGLQYPKKVDKLPFETWEQIERIIRRGGLTEQEKDDLWDSLFLSLEQIAEVLDYARAKPTKNRFFYPLLVIAAHTGARRSEIIRSRVEDFKFDDGNVLIREKKKDQSTYTFRTIPMSPLLRTVMQDYLRTGHPGGNFTISVRPGVAMTEQNVAKTFGRFFKGSKWEVLQGYHVFRHSFASNLALKRVDERVIDELMCHQTEAMRRRYRHLFPEAYQDAIVKLFGKG
jgi:integrase